MLKRRLFALGLPALIVFGLSLFFATAAFGQGDRGRNGEFRASLNGYNERPLSISTRGHGDFQARLTSASMLQYSLTISDLEGGVASAAHIHLGQRAVAGGVIAFLCGGGGKPACPVSGTVTGTITPADVIGPAGQGIAAGEFAELIRAMRAGATYANVHNATYPPGEIRGQIRNGDDPGRGDD